MEMEMVEEVVIVGAGIAGLALAVALKKVGTAIGLWRNAWLALNQLGVSHKLTSVYPLMNKGYITNLVTKVVREISSSAHDDGTGRRMVHRKALITALAEELESDSIKFCCKITSIETEGRKGSSIAVVRVEDGSVIKAKILIGCDGVHSVVAKWLGLSEPIDSGRSAVRGVSVYPRGHGLKHEFSQFVGAGQRAGMAPLNHTQIYWFLTFPSSTKGPYLGGEDPEETKKELIENLPTCFPSQFLDVVKNSDPSSLTRAPLMFRNPWSVAFGALSRGCVTMCGDAMHPMTPDLAQGGGAALEDAVVLARHLQRIASGGGTREEAVIGYKRERRWRAAWLIFASVLSGWVQQGASFWGMRFFRDFVFYKFLARNIYSSAVCYYCGKL